MRCPHLDQLPAPPPGTSGWPWTEASTSLPDRAPTSAGPSAPSSDSATTTAGDWPLISVVTPSFNQQRYLEETLRSILLQGYPNVELLVIDGGSTDGSVELIRRYEPWIAHWVSERDRGQSHALNKGFAKATGAWIGWQNSDDVYHRDCFAPLARAATHHPDASVLYGQLTCIDDKGNVVRENSARDFRLEDGIPWFELGNQSLFFRRDIFDGGAFLDESFHHCMDSEFWWRLIFAGRSFQYVPEMGGSFRIHGEAKTAKQQDVNTREANRLFAMILDWQALPQQTKSVALQRYRAFLATAFDAGHFDVFASGIAAFVKRAGWHALGSGLASRYLSTFAGHTAASTMIAFAKRLGGRRVNGPPE